jgi:hypothetical protein
VNIVGYAHFCYTIDVSALSLHRFDQHFERQGLASHCQYSKAVMIET